MKIRLTKKFVIKARKAEVMPTPGRWAGFPASIGGDFRTAQHRRKQSSTRRAPVVLWAL